MNSSSRFILLACVVARVATAQIQFHFGVEAGVPLTDTLSSSTSSSVSGGASSFDRYNSVTKRLLIGPAFRLEMGSGLGIEVDALYQRINYDHTTVSTLPAPLLFGQSEQTTANRWQFPLMVQYARTLSNLKTRPFVEAGLSISRLADRRSTILTAMKSPSSNSSSMSTITGQGGTLAGIVAGGGVDFPLRRLHLRPEFRYSHWFSQNAASPAAVAGVFVGGVGTITTVLPPLAVAPTFRTKQNEANFLLGLTF
jgi:outer membrane protein with beta-barrel domain